MKRMSLTIAMLTVILMGCQSPELESFYADKIITVTPDGTMEPYAHYTPEGELLDDGYPVFDDQLNDIEYRVKSSGRKKILIYVYGGMNSVDETVEWSRELIDSIWATSDHYPLMICWESSLFESYGDHLCFIRNGVRSYWLGIPLTPFVFLADLSRGLTNLPINTIRQAAEPFDTEHPEKDYAQLYTTVDSRSTMQYSLGADYGKRLGFWRRALYGIALPVRVVTTTLINVCGKNAWDIMIHRSRTAFDTYGVGVVNTDIDDYIPVSVDPESGVLAQLMQRLRTMQQADSELEITLIGHSMGPFIINEMLILYGDIKYKNIVYMSPACTIREGVAAVKPYLQRHPETTFYNLCVHPRAEKEEMMEYAVLPRGSVLEWIDLYFSNQIDVDDYTMGRWNLAMLRFPRLFGEVQDRVVNKAFGINDPRTNTRNPAMPVSHTDFSDPQLRFWQSDFWQPLTDSKPSK